MTDDGTANTSLHCRRLIIFHRKDTHSNDYVRMKRGRLFSSGSTLWPQVRECSVYSPLYVTSPTYERGESKVDVQFPFPRQLILQEVYHLLSHFNICPTFYPMHTTENILSTTEYRISNEMKEIASSTVNDILPFI